jgi:hypothetical protein
VQAHGFRSRTNGTTWPLPLDAARNKAIFDALVAKRNEIEADFGGKLDWQRLDSKRASRVSIGFPGGWVSELTWPDVIPKIVAAMERLYKVLSKRAVAAKDAT